MRLKDILSHLLKVLEQKRISVPRYSTLAGLIMNAFRKYEKWMLSKSTSCLSEADRQLLDDLLTVDEYLYSTSETQDVTW